MKNIKDKLILITGEASGKSRAMDDFRGRA